MLFRDYGRVSSETQRATTERWIIIRLSNAVNQLTVIMLCNINEFNYFPGRAESIV